MDGFLLILLIILGLAVYFIPTIVAFVSQQENRVAIMVLDILLGWTLVGWVVSLVWAVKKNRN